MIKLTEEEKRERKRIRQAKYRIENKEKIAKSREKSREKKRLYDAKYYTKNKETIKLQGTNWRLANNKSSNAITAKYRKKNRVKCNLLSNKYHAKNNDKNAAKAARYRATKFGATIYMTKEDKAKVADLYTIASDATKLFGYVWAVDHIIPLNKGGLHKLTNLQVVPATWNSVKGDRNSDLYWG